MNRRTLLQAVCGLLGISLVKPAASKATDAVSFRGVPIVWDAQTLGHDVVRLLIRDDFSGIFAVMPKPPAEHWGLRVVRRPADQEDIYVFVDRVVKWSGNSWTAMIPVNRNEFMKSREQCPEEHFGRMVDSLQAAINACEKPIPSGSDWYEPLTLEGPA